MILVSDKNSNSTVVRQLVSLIHRISNTIKVMLQLLLSNTILTVPIMTRNNSSAHILLTSPSEKNGVL